MKLFPAAATRVRLADIIAASSLRKDAFIAIIAGRLGMSDGVALTSLMRNTCAAMEALPRPEGVLPEIILPRYACPSFIHGIQATDASARYCDIDPDKLTINPALVEAVRTPRTTAVLVPNLFGLSADMVALADYCREKGLLLIEGADYSFGGRFAGRPLGSFGDLSILNFQEGKALPIGGGLTLFRQAGGPAASPGSIARRPGHRSSVLAFLRSLAYCVFIRPLLYGIFTSLLSVLRLPKKRFSMEDTLRRTENEFDYAITDSDRRKSISSFQASLGVELLKTLEAQREIRWRHAIVLEQALGGISGLRLVPRHPRLEICHYIRYPILIGGGRRDALCAHLLRAGFEASPMYVEYGMSIAAETFPGSARVCAELLTLPCHPLMEQADILRMAGVVRHFLA